MQDDPHYVREAFAAGASGYVLKEAADTDVVAAIRDVAAGGQLRAPALGARMLVADAEERKRAEEDPLSDRERDVLRLLALGHTNQEIADTALHLRAHGRDPPGAHHAEAAAADPGGARPLRDRAGVAGDGRRLGGFGAEPEAQESESDDCGREHVGREAPLADRVDHGQLDVQQVRTEEKGGERERRLAQTGPVAAGERRHEQGQKPDQAERRDRNAEHDCVGRALDCLAATGRADQRAAGLTDVRR